MVDTGRDGTDSYADVVGRAIQQESWIKTENSVSLGVGEGLKETTQPTPLQVYRNQRSGRILGLQSRKPNSQDKSGGSGGKS